MKPLNERLDAGYVVSQSGCWIWVKGKNQYGYGLIYAKPKKRLVTHLMYERYKGPIQSGMIIMHTCDTPECCNPDHLISGTQRDNMRDCVAKGRSNKGSRNGLAKLDEDTVNLIRDEIGTQIAIAEKYGVHQSTISLIKRGKTW